MNTFLHPMRGSGNIGCESAQSFGRRGPLLFDAAIAPHQQSDGPGDDEDPDDDEADGVEVQTAEPVPERAAPPQLAGEQPEQFDAADQQRDGDRQRR